MGIVIAIVAIALVFDYINGFHDAANSIATIVSTRVLTPRRAVVAMLVVGVLCIVPLFSSAGISRKGWATALEGFSKETCRAARHG